LIDTFPASYQPVLAKIKDAYDNALVDSLSSCIDNVHMREEVASHDQEQVSVKDDCHSDAGACATAHEIH